MKHLKLRKAHIVGCSMGASTALNFRNLLRQPHSLSDIGRRRRRFRIRAPCRISAQHGGECPRRYETTGASGPRRSPD